MFNESNILDAEIWLAKFFVDISPSNHVSTKFVTDEFRQFIRGTGLKRSDLKEARKRLGVHSENVNGEYVWTWKSEDEPHKVWDEKCKEFWRRINAGKGN